MDSQTTKIEVELDEDELKIIDFVGKNYCVLNRSEIIKSIIRNQPDAKSKTQELDNKIGRYENKIEKYHNEIEKYKEEIRKYQDEIKKLRKDNINLKKEPKILRAPERVPE